MRVTSLTAVCARTRLRHSFQHASHVRTENDSLLVRCELDTGHVGWGEGLPRTYVTGETIETAWSQLEATFARVDAQGDDTVDLIREPFDSLQQLVRRIADWDLNTESWNGPESFLERGCAGNAARCAVELALLDAVGQATETPLDQLPAVLGSTQAADPPKPTVQYGLVVSPATIKKALKWGFAARWHRFADVKIKLGLEGAPEKAIVAWLRRLAGSRVAIRADINEAWPAASIPDHLAELGRQARHIESIEQPCPHDEIAELATLRGDIPPVVLDESLCSLTDAQAAIDGRYGDIFNLRVSKCGGLTRSIQLADIAAAHGLRYQIGCQVGESGILSAAGRALACGLANPTRLEGSYDRYLVQDPLTTEDLTFTRGGYAPRLPRGGLGITIDETAIKHITQRQQTLI